MFMLLRHKNIDTLHYDKSDEQFREEFKPLQIAATYSQDAKPEDKILFALAQLGEASSAD